MNRANFHTAATGLALFSMFFGAGNIVFPLMVGQAAGEMSVYAIAGLMVTAVAVPVLGLMAVILFDGDFLRFFTLQYRSGDTFTSSLGVLPGGLMVLLRGFGFFLMLLAMALFGPFLAIPRTITMAHATIHYGLLEMPLWQFSAISCAVIALLTVNRSQVIHVLGCVLTPLLLLFIAFLVYRGWAQPGELLANDAGAWEMVRFGVLLGCNTLDLIGGLFFSLIIIESIRQYAPKDKSHDYRYLMMNCLKAGLLGGGLLGLIYAGICLVSARYSTPFVAADVEQAQLLSALSYHLMGHMAGVFASLVTALACLSTAMALVVVFSEFIQQHVFRYRVGYAFCVAITLSITYMMSLLGFRGLMDLVAPLIKLCYPVYITLCVVNMAVILRFKAVGSSKISTAAR